MKVSICSVVYDAVRPYFYDYVKGIVAAIESYKYGDVNLIIVSDGFDNIQDSLQILCEKLPVHITTAPVGLSHSEIRKLLLESAKQKGHEALIFVDTDDIPVPEILLIHSQTLTKYDFSYSDQILIDLSGRNTGKKLYDEWSVPKTLYDLNVLLDGNFIGFSGLAIRKSSLSEKICSVPSNIIAVDWWLSSLMINSGSTGGLTSAPVVYYRQHDNNAIGARPSNSSAAINQRINIAMAHFLNLPVKNLVGTRLRGLELLAKLMEKDSGRVRSLIEKSYSNDKSWYSDVISLGLDMIKY